ncbi:short chain dehydrogenase [Modestobacter sp. DSM 44400]|nr:short chain dehydrogenase [Modestobacter sp. DSM 44400]
MQAINLRAVVRLTHGLLPVLKANPGAHLVNVSSLFGLIAPAGQTAYSTSKYAVRGFTEALRAELAGDGVGVTCVHPGGNRTRIAESAGRFGSARRRGEAGKRQFAKLLTMDPAKAAELVVRGGATSSATADGRQRRRAGRRRPAVPGFLRPDRRRGDDGRRRKELAAALSRIHHSLSMPLVACAPTTGPVPTPGPRPPAASPGWTGIRSAR